MSNNLKTNFTFTAPLKDGKFEATYSIPDHDVALCVRSAEASVRQPHIDALQGLLTAMLKAIEKDGCLEAKGSAEVVASIVINAVPFELVMAIDFAQQSQAIYSFFLGDMLREVCTYYQETVHPEKCYWLQDWWLNGGPTPPEFQ